MIGADRGGGGPRRLAQGQLQGVGGFDVEGAVADLIGVGRQVDAIGIEFLRRGGALRARQRHRARPAGHEVPDRRTRDREGFVLGVGQADGRGLLPLLTQGALQMPVAQLVLFHHEQAGVLGRAGGQEALLADRGEVALAQLQADYALEAGDLAMLGLDATVIALVGEGGRDDAFF
ncbi:hypothetical protein D3C72_1029510 [compost metagenome]